MDIAVIWIPPRDAEIHFDAHPLPNTFAKNYREKLIACLKNNPDRKIKLYILARIFTNFHIRLLNQLKEDHTNLDIVFIEKMDFGEYDVLQILRSDVPSSFLAYLCKDRDRVVSLRNEIDVLKLLVLLTVTRPTALYDFDMLPQHCVREDPRISNRFDILFAPYKNELTSHVMAVKGGDNPLLKRVHTYLKNNVTLDAQTPQNIVESLYFYALHHFESLNNMAFVPNFAITLYDPDFQEQIIVPGKFAYRDGAPLNFDYDNRMFLSDDLYEVELQERAEYYEYLKLRNVESKLASELIPSMFHDLKFGVINEQKFATAIRRVYNVLLTMGFPDDTKMIFQQHLENIAADQLRAVRCSSVFFCILEVLFDVMGHRDLEYVTRLLARIRPDEHYYDGSSCKRFCRFFFIKMNFQVESRLILCILKLTSSKRSLNRSMSQVCDVLLDELNMSLELVLCILHDVRTIYGY